MATKTLNTHKTICIERDGLQLIAEIQIRENVVVNVKTTLTPIQNPIEIANADEASKAVAHLKRHAGVLDELASQIQIHTEHMNDKPNPIIKKPSEQ